MDKQPLVDFNQNLKSVPIKRIIRPHNIEEKLRKDIIPDGIKKMTIFVHPVEEFFDKFPLPEDCQKLVILHMLFNASFALES